jgi:hypothetical protein
VIEDLQPGDWIDLDQLGNNPLRTYIKYDGVAIDDVLWPNWRGCGEQGEVADHSNSRVDVTYAGGYTPQLGMPVLVPNDLLKQLNQGWAFYSYAIGLPGDPNVRGPESLRQFCYVGKRATKSTRLPVAQIQQSHDLALDPDAVSSAGAIAVVPPYRAMSVADKVIFTWQGYFQGTPEPAYRETKVLKAEDLGQPLTFTVPYTEVIGIEGEHADIKYRVEYADGAGLSSDSDQQTLQIVAPVSSPLPAITIKDHTGGPINPGHYPDGLVLQVKPVYAGIQEGDWGLVYWNGSDKTKSVIKSQRVDRSTLDSGLIEFLIEARWLKDNSNAQVTVSYQFAREGAAQSADPLQVDISKPLYLPAPIVEGATPEGENNGRLEASTSGAYVSIPESAEVGSGKVELHWQGHPNGGRHIALTPVGGNDKRYFIPASAIAANMSTLEKARFPVFYRVFPPGDATGEDSAYFNLHITPLPATRYPFTTSIQIVDNKMSLFSVPIGGADLDIHSSPPSDAWPFMAQGQLLTMEVTGVTQGGGDTSHFVRNAAPVTAVEFQNKKITVKLPKDFLRTLKINEPFTLKARVSFDGGETYIQFRNSTPTLVP